MSFSEKVGEKLLQMPVIISLIISNQIYAKYFQKTLKNCDCSYTEDSLDKALLTYLVLWKSDIGKQSHVTNFQSAIQLLRGFYTRRNFRSTPADF